MALCERFPLFLGEQMALPLLQQVRLEVLAPFAVLLAGVFLYLSAPPPVWILVVFQVLAGLPACPYLSLQLFCLAFVQLPVPAGLLEMKYPLYPWRLVPPPLVPWAACLNPIQQLCCTNASGSPAVSPSGANLEVSVLFFESAVRRMYLMVQMAE